jgi:hypothetical protein
VVEGIFQYEVAKVELSEDEARRLFDALSFVETEYHCQKKVTKLVKEARAKKLEGRKLFFFFEEKLSA